jgi:flavin-dependent dehydrogenase
VPGDFSAADWKGTLPLTRRARKVAGERIFLIGDAAGYIEPFTGEGLAWAMATGLAVAPLALEGTQAWSPRLSSRWSNYHRRHIVTRQRASRLLSRVLRRPIATRLLVELLAAWPALALPMVHGIAKGNCIVDAGSLQ